MNKSTLAFAVAIGVAISGMMVHDTRAAELVPVFFDDPGEGYNDPTPVAPVSGNPGTTRGDQRRIVAQFAADLWGAVLRSNEPVYIGAQFNPLGANVLGSAGATFVFRDFPGAAFPSTWYSAALAESIVGSDLTGPVVDINSQFSSDFNFYYGLDGNTPAGMVSFLDVVMHEYGHGLGFQNFENEAAGTFLQNFPDVYSQFTFDNSQGLFWPQMTIAERQQSAINYGNVVFTGAFATAGAALILDDRLTFRVTAPGSIAGEYPFGTASFGPPASPANFNGTVVVGLDDAIPGTSPTTTDGCSPLTNAAEVAGNIAIMDRGTCGFAVKAKNAQDAGAIGVIIANNAAGSPPPGLGGVDPTVVIPAISVTQSDGALIKSNTPAQVTLVVDPTKLQGADDAGRPRLFMPNPVQPGSSGSHYDTALAPNALMEPSINDSLNAALNIDISAHLLRDTGWVLNTGNALIAGCDTTIKVIDEVGIIIGANVEATSNLLLATSPDKATYQSRMEAYKDQLVASGLITGRQGGKMMACAAKTRP